MPLYWASGGMPGPLTVVVLHQAVSFGALAGPLAALSHGLLELAIVAALAAGLGRVLNRPGVAATIALVGGLVLVWMGWGMVAAARAATLPKAGTAAGLPGPGPFVAGALATLSNPYWFLWWLTVGMSQLAWARPPRRLAFWAGHVSSDLAWLTLLAVAAATGRRFLSDATYQLVLYLMGGVICLLGLYFVASARRLYRLRPAEAAESPAPTVSTHVPETRS